MSLVARHLEETGFSTVIIGSARDIVEQCAVPRFLFTDLPLGNPCGRPFDQAMQATVVAGALDLLESATAPLTTVKAPVSWGEESWRSTYMTINADSS